MKKLILSIVALYIATCCCATTTTSLTPTHNTYTDSGNPNVNYGSDTVAYVFQDVNGNGNIFDLYAILNISQLPSTIISASCVFQQVYTSPDELIQPYLLFDVYEIVTNWTETSITYNNSPVVLRKTRTDHQDGDVNNVVVPLLDIVQTGKNNNKQFVGFKVRSSYPYVPVYTRRADVQYRVACPVTF